MKRRHEPATGSDLRCAIYTRKSTEEGLEQAFNSLDAQREACAAYISSQRHEGWLPSPEIYDDGGFSGGSMDRPALKRLLMDVRSGRINIIVVYKVDRLTRSLADFAKIVEVLDAAGASFVSVTQAFNTTTSMGRLTLNVLLSFAQFEREVTGERIRDKIAASKARGMWMGGNVPLGYEVRDRKLIVNEHDAQTVRMIFERYLALGSVLALQAELAAKGLRSKARISRNGRAYGAAAFSRGALYLMLKNRIYLGEVSHKGKAYPGEHAAIMDPTVFNQAQALMEKHRRDYDYGANCTDPSLLAGIIWDGVGRRMTPNHASKGSRRYRYYVSRIDPTAPPCDAWRVPAGDLEAVIITRLRALLDASLTDGLNDSSSERAIASQTLASGTPGEQRAGMLQWIERITVEENCIRLQLSIADFAWEDACPSIEARLVRRGKEVRLAFAPDAGGDRFQDASLIKLVVKANAARQALDRAEHHTLAELASEQGYTRDYFAVLLRLSYLAPDITAAILDGRQPVQLNRQRLARAANLPLEWQAQREMLGFA
jgi:DNA invertase Pin-like site-specific DNA recombinase